MTKLLRFDEFLPLSVLELLLSRALVFDLTAHLVMGWLEHAKRQLELVVCGRC